MSANAFFIDTNILVHQLEGLDSTKASLADGLIREGIASGDGCISFQVVQECINTFVRKAELPLSEAQMRQYLEDVLHPLWKVYPSLALYQASIDILRRYRFGFYDSLIVASALQAGCKTLYTEDLQHGQQIDDLVIKNPFQIGNLN